MVRKPSELETDDDIPTFSDVPYSVQNEEEESEGSDEDEEVNKSDFR